MYAEFHTMPEWHGQLMRVAMNWANGLSTFHIVYFDKNRNNQLTYFTQFEEIGQLRQTRFQSDQFQFLDSVNEQSSFFLQI